jgi:hypothetical protein
VDLFSRLFESLTSSEHYVGLKPLGFATFLDLS